MSAGAGHGKHQATDGVYDEDTDTQVLGTAYPLRVGPNHVRLVVCRHISRSSSRNDISQW